MKVKKELLIKIAFLVLAILIAFGIYEFFILRKAHSTFDDYYAFRGCVELLEKTEDYGVCKVASGQTIKIVKIWDKWYLDGDGPDLF